MSGELWFAEGFTNYYGPLVLERAGIANLDTFLHGMGEAIDSVLTSPGRIVFNAVDMSRLAPFVDAATSIDPNNFTNTFISYYTYGQALAFGIDLAMRERFPGKSLDDWMRVMWREHPDIDNGAQITSGARRGSPLYEAGLDKGDRILRWDGKVLKNAGDLDTWLDRHKPGDRVQLKVNTRSGDEQVSLVLQEDLGWS